MDTERYSRIFHQLKPYLTVIFLAIVGYLLYESLSQVKWSEVGGATKKVTVSAVLISFGLAILNYFILTSYDYLGFRYLEIRKMNYLKVLPSAFISYAFNLNLGALIGGLGFRYRIYTNWGVEKGKIPLVVLFSTLSNWLGYVFLLSLILFFKPQKIIELTGLPIWLVYSVGVIAILLVVAYLLLCFKRYELNFKQHHFKFPKISLAFLQLTLSVLQWLIISSIIYFLLNSLEATIAYEQVLFTCLMASIAGVVSHVPAGLGVLEAVFLKMNFDTSNSLILVALLTYRFVYYLLPLILALPAYLFLEIYQKKNS
jgi:uncharacterized membrane protein YbhN (UPF0104 family)